ncbi:MAG: PEP-CTERM system TPR-repeat protein PrsT, partial [Gammaproteobacteria bacterium]
MTKIWTKRFPGTTALLLWGLMWVQAAAAATTQSYIQDAQRYFNDGKYEAAVIQLKNALQQNADNGQARLLLGKTYLKLGDGAAAESQLERAKDLGVARKDWMVPLGKAYLLRGKSQKVLHDIEPQSSLPTSIRAAVLALRGEALLIQGQPLDAQKSFSASLALEPKQPEALLGQARIAFSDKDKKTTLAKIDQALAADPNSLDGWLLKGEVYRREADYKESKKAFAHALVLAPSSIPAQLGVATAELGLRQDDEALKLVGKVLHKVPSLPVANYLKALIMFRKGDLDHAQTLLQTALRSAPNYPAAHLLLGTVDYVQGDLNEAEVHLRKYTNSMPNNVAAMKLLGATLIKLDEANDAVDVLAAANKQVPKDPQTLALLGTAYLRSGDANQGLKYLRQASEIDPDFAAGKAQLAMQSAVHLGPGLVQADALLILTQIHKGDYDGALTSARAFAKKHPKDALAYNLEGAAYLGKKDFSEARAAFKKALEVNPKFHAARINLARLDVLQGKLEDAEREYGDVLANAPGNLNALLGMAELAGRRGDEQKQLKLLRKAQDSNPAATQPALLLVDHYLKAGDALKAVDVARTLQTAHPKSPDYLPAQVGLTRLELARKEIPKAHELATRIQQQHPKLALGYELNGDIYAADKEYGAAAKSYASAYDRQASRELAIKRYQMLKMHGDASGSLGALRQWLAKSPNDNKMQLLLATAYEQAGQDQHAIKRYEAVLVTDPHNVTALNNLAWLYRDTDRGKALAYAERAY